MACCPPAASSSSLSVFPRRQINHPSNTSSKPNFFLRLSSSRGSGVYLSFTSLHTVRRAHSLLPCPLFLSPLALRKINVPRMCRRVHEKREMHTNTNTPGCAHAEPHVRMKPRNSLSTDYHHSWKRLFLYPTHPPTPPLQIQY